MVNGGKIAIITDQPSWTGIGTYAHALFELIHNEFSNVLLIYTGAHFDYSDKYYKYDKFMRTTAQTKIPYCIKHNYNLLKKDKGLQKHLFHYVGAEYKLLQKIPGIVTVHDLIKSKIKEPILKKPMEVLGLTYRNFIINVLKRYLSTAIYIIVISNRVKNSLDESLYPKTKTIYHWIEKDVFHYRDKKYIKEKLNLDANINYLLAIGNNRLLKRTDLIKSFAENLPKNWIVLKIGSPILSDNVLNIGVLPDKYTYAEYFNASEALLHFSDDEGFGRPLIEAMGSGIPIITRKTEINVEILGEAGIYLELNSEGSPHWDILDVFEMRGYIEKITKELQSRSLLFSKDFALKEYTSLYDRFVKD